MGLMCLLVEHQLQCWSSLCLHPESGLLLSCFYIAPLWLQRFLWGGRWREVFTPFSLCMESKALEKSTNNIVASRFFARTPSRIRRIVFYVPSQFWVLCGCVVEHCRSWPLWTVVFGYSEVTLLREKGDASLCPSVYCILVIYDSMSSNSLVFYTSGGIRYPAQTITDVDYADDSASGKFTRASLNPAT